MSEDGTATSIEIFLGEPGSFNKVSNFSSGSTSLVESGKIDGYGPGVMSGFTINDAVPLKWNIPMSKRKKP